MHKNQYLRYFGPHPSRSSNDPWPCAQATAGWKKFNVIIDDSWAEPVRNAKKTRVRCGGFLSLERASSLIMMNCKVELESEVSELGKGAEASVEVQCSPRQLTS